MTAQFSESLIYNGKQLPMCTNPLGLYLAQTGLQFVSPNTANWRGYRGTWEVKGNSENEQRLYLIRLAANKSYEEVLSLKDVFPDSPKGVFAHWYSGAVRCPQGNQIKYVHMGYSSVYEYDFFLEFKRGVLINKYVIHNTLEEPKKHNLNEIPAFLRPQK